MKGRLRECCLFFLIAFLPAMAVRIWYLSDFAALPLFGQVAGPDVSEYFAEAQKICAGQWLPREVLIHAPLYPYLLALILAVSCGEMFLVRLGQSLLFSLLLQLPVFLMLRKRTAGLSSPMRFLPYVAALLLGVYPPLVICQADFYSENLMMVLLLFSLWSFMLHLRWSDGLAGVFAGLAALAHPGCIFFLPLAGLYAWLRLPGKKSSLRSGGLRCASFCLGAFLMIAPVSLRNSLLAHRPVLIQDNSMFNFALGNSLAATGTCRLPPGIRWEKEFEYANYEAAKQGISLDTYYRRQFFRYVSRQPLHYLKNLLKKAAMTFSAREFTTWSDATSGGFIFWHKYIYQNWFLVLLLLGGPVLLIGLFRKSFRRFMGPEMILFGAVFAGQVFLLTAGRYRMPLVIPLSVFAGYFLCRPKRFLGTFRSAGLTIGAMIGLFILGSYPYAIPRQVERDYARSLLAEAWVMVGKPGEAVKLYENPAAGDCFPERRLSILGQAWYALGNLPRAGECFRQLIDDYPWLPQGYLNYASVLTETGHPLEAEKILKAGLARNPKGSVRADMEYNLGEIAQRSRRLAEAASHYRRALSIVPTHRKALNNLGTLYLMTREPAKAIPLFERAVRLEPGNVRLRLNLAVALAMNGREAEARKVVAEVLRRDPSNTAARKLMDMLPR